MRTCPPLLCPVCAGPLTEAEHGYRCGRGHAFDRSRHGYVDLLPHGHGRSNRAGDSREMIAARQRFLERGHYAALRDAVAEEATRRLHGIGAPVVLDAGCGDGWYLEGVHGALRDDACGFGFDISAHALRAAARRCRGCTFFLNDVTHRICLPDASVDLLLDVFAPRNAAEFARVMRPEGTLLVVIPGEAHLEELSGMLAIGMGADKRDATLAALNPFLELEHEAVLQYGMALDRDAILDLLGMTPSAHHADPAAAAAKLKLPGQAVHHVTAAFRLLVLRRSAAR